MEDSALDMDLGIFSTRNMGNIIVIEFNAAFFMHIADIAAKQAILDYLQLISGSSAIKVILILGSPVDRGKEDYQRFYRDLSHLIANQDAIHRIYNGIDQFILAIRNMDKFVIHVERRKTISLFLNAAFACDYRIVGDNAAYHNCHLDMGLLPKGGIVFFLSRLLGCAKAGEILLSVDDMTAHTAMQYGIVDRIAAPDELEQVALRTASTFARQPASSLSGIKRLLNCDLGQLQDSLERENDELFRIVNASEYRNDMRGFITD